jgi:hypothetical protein
MNCPSCRQQASSLMRSAFSLQGVSIFKSAQGYFKCQHCGTHLRVIGFGRKFWFLLLSAIAVLALFMLLYGHIITILGNRVTAVVWAILVLATPVVLLFGMWKYRHVEEIQVDINSTTKSSL